MKNSKIIRYYKEKEFKAIPDHKVFECIHCIDPKLFSDMEILRKWEEFYKGLKVPYCITEKPYKGGKPMLSLWKERYV